MYCTQRTCQHIRGAEGAKPLIKTNYRVVAELFCRAETLRRVKTPRGEIIKQRPAASSFYYFLV